MVNFYAGVEHQVVNFMPLRLGFQAVNNWYVTTEEGTDENNHPVTLYHASKIVTPMITGGSSIKLMDNLKIDLGFGYTWREYEAVDMFGDAYYNDKTYTGASTYALWPILILLYKIAVGKILIKCVRIISPLMPALILLVITMKRALIILVALTLFCPIAKAEDLRLDLIFSNDVHGGIDRSEATFMNPDFPPLLGGGGSAATLIKHIRSLADNERRDNLLLDAGDIFQGRPVGTVTNGKAVVEFMNAIGYDAMTIGNHEFDIPEEKLKETLQLAKFPILSCNLIDKRTNQIPAMPSPILW